MAEHESVVQRLGGSEVTRWAEAVVAVEASALESLRSALPADLPAVVEAVSQIEGRLIVTGVGKSGHIARKIAATLASTGTPAQAIYPAEASHGDLGMAPTSSTTVAMVMGDALAVCLMRQKGFSPDDFRDFHPGGKLGAQLLTVDALMHAGDALPIVTPDTPMGMRWLS